MPGVTRQDIEHILLGTRTAGGIWLISRGGSLYDPACMLVQTLANVRPKIGDNDFAGIRVRRYGPLRAKAGEEPADIASQVITTRTSPTACD
jgi:hypothetical protein